MSSRRRPRVKNSENKISGIPSSKKELRMRYNKLVIIDLEKRAVLRDLVKRSTLCQHKQVYTQANAISRRMTTSYEEGKISVEQALELIMESHEQMTHKGMPKEVVAGEMNKRLDKLENLKDGTVKVTMANSSRNVDTDGFNSGNGKSRKAEEPNKYSESYWAEII